MIYALLLLFALLCGVVSFGAATALARLTSPRRRGPVELLVLLGLNLGATMVFMGPEIGGLRMRILTVFAVWVGASGASLVQERLRVRRFAEIRTLSPENLALDAGVLPRMTPLENLTLDDLDVTVEQFHQKTRSGLTGNEGLVQRAYRFMSPRKIDEYLRDESLEWRVASFESELLRARFQDQEGPPSPPAPADPIAPATGASGAEDATRDYFDTFREQGRYGSHPSHDDYGDEGSP